MFDNITTTRDELFQEELFADIASNPAAKEVRKYAAALKKTLTLSGNLDFLPILIS